MKSLLKNFPFFIYCLLIIFLFSLVLSLPYFSQLNNLFLDQLQGQIKPSPEIIVVGIDDKSLNEIGAWPWDRSVFAKALQNLNKQTPGVVGIDILFLEPRGSRKNDSSFLEPRSGDEELKKTLTSINYPVILASKLTADNYLESILVKESTQSGFVNFVSDQDGKIRTTNNLVSLNQRLYYNFAFRTYYTYRQGRDYLGNTAFPESYSFEYTNQPFKSISFIDLYNNQIPENTFKNKIVLIGVTTTDLKNDLTDNFTDVFGQKTPGIIIHANIINSFLQGKYRTNFTSLPFYIFMVLVILPLLFAYRRFKNNILQFLIFLISLIIVNIYGLLIYEGSLNFPFLQANILMIVTFIYVIAYKYFVEQKENRFVQKAFSSYLNPKLLRSLIEHPEKLKLGGEKKEITVLFSDIRGFTTLSEKMTPEELISFINDYLDAMSEIILKNNGTIDKFIGDAIMALWNAPLDDKAHKENAIKSALEMAQKLEEFNLATKDKADIKIGVGINTGEVVVGNVGSKTRFDYTVLGDNVNLASRIEGLTKKYKVNILVAESVILPRHSERSEESLNSFENSIIFRLIDEVIVKGKETPVKIYQPLINNEENKNLKTSYEKAFKLYQKADFKKALEIFKTLKGDGPSEVMIDRMSEIKTSKHFTGIWHWDEK